MERQPGMVEVTEGKGIDSYLARFARLERDAFADGPGWLLPLRKAAIARFAHLGFPTTRHEEWLYTNVAPIARTAFEPGGSVGVDLGPRERGLYMFGSADTVLLVFVNGRYAPSLSSPPGSVDGVAVGSLWMALDDNGRPLESHLTRYANYQEHAFTALNTAFMEDGAFVHIPKGKILEQPVHVVYVSTAAGPATISHPRSLIVADENSQATIVESFVGPAGGTYFTNAVTEISAGENSSISHYKIVNEAADAFHVGTLQIHQQRSSNVSSHTVSLDGRLVRNDINALMAGEGCECTLNGLYMVDGERHVDNHVVVDHAMPHCSSRESFKGVLDGRGRGVFSGRIIVREDAQKTDAKQTNMSLLLSDQAQVESKPQLEIFADDVKCTHGATIGQVSEEAVFYLQSRGMSEQAARSLLVYAFARESVDRIRLRPLREQLAERLFTRVPQGQLLREVV